MSTQAQARYLLREIPRRHRQVAHSQLLSEQPFDGLLLKSSRLYRQSRKLFLENSGTFRATLLSSPRSLSSASLLANEIQYSPIERELVWAATDPLQRKSPEHLLSLRTFVTSIYHEQNHRLLWNWLPAPSPKLVDLHRYLNLVESLVVTLDMALGDELGQKNAEFFYLCGPTYDPGTDVKKGLSKRGYRNYLQAALYSTYLTLELYTSKEVAQLIAVLFPDLGGLGQRAVQRSCRLDPEFVKRTNPLWQHRHGKEVLKKLRASSRRKPSLEISDDPRENHAHYLIAEQIFDRFDL